MGKSVAEGNFLAKKTLSECWFCVQLFDYFLCVMSIPVFLFFFKIFSICFKLNILNQNMQDRLLKTRSLPWTERLQCLSISSFWQISALKWSFQTKISKSIWLDSSFFENKILFFFPPSITFIDQGLIVAYNDSWALCQACQNRVKEKWL